MRLMDALAWSEVTDENLNFMKAIGVDCLLVMVPPEFADGRDPTDEFRRMKRFVTEHGLELHVLHSGGLPRDQIVYGLPGREQQLDGWCKVLRAIGAVGVPATATTFFAIQHFRTPSTLGRGGARLSTWNYEEFMKDRAADQDHLASLGGAPSGDFPGKEITEERMWESIAWFLQRVVPVAEEAGVRIALHPDDPPVPEPLGGAARIVVSLENYQRIFALAPGPANGMLFCQGCVAEMGENVYEAIRTIGGQGRIVFVHFRNIRGTRYNFQEVFIDEGDVDMLRAMEAYRDAGFQGPFMMDHTPGIPHPSGHWAGRAYANGYIRALLQTVYRAA